MPWPEFDDKKPAYFYEMIKKKYRPGAIGALLDEYERAILDLIKTIEGVSDHELIQVVDTKTTDPNCRSIQTILSHVVHAAYGYAVSIQKLKIPGIQRPDRLFYSTVKEYQQDLNRVFEFTKSVFKAINDKEIEQFEVSKKIHTAWGQIYDIEQMMEHGIVHILRHRRQIEKFKLALRGL